VSNKVLWTNVSGGQSVRSVLILPNKTIRTFDSGDDASTFTGDITAFKNILDSAGISKGSVSDTEKPTVTIISPSKDTSISFNESFIVKWNASDNVGITSIKIESSTTNGSSWSVISESSSNDGSETLNSLAEGSYQIRITAVDAAGNSQSVVSESLSVLPDSTLVSSKIGVLKDAIQLVDMKLNLGTELQNGLFTIVGLDGRIILNRQIASTTVDLGSLGLAKGVYLLRVNFDGSYASSKFIVK